MADSLSIYPPEVVGAAIAALKNAGITNLEMQAAVLATIAKESGFKPRSESSYSGTANARLRAIFGSHLTDLSEDDLTSLKADDTAFFDKIYGNRNGNTNAGDGWNYRGRGLNQITFKSIYKAIGDIIGIDLVSSPDQLNEPTTAAAAAAAFFVLSFKQAKASGQLKSKIGVDDISQVTDTTTAVKACVMANAGWGTNFNAPVVQEGYNKALAAVVDFKNALVTTIKQNPKSSAAVGFFLCLQQLL